MVKPGYKQTEIGQIPTDWDIVPLLDKVELLNGLTYTPNNIHEHGLLVMRSSNVQNGRFTFDDNVYVDCEVDDTKLIRSGDILICVRNGSAALIGKCAKADRDYRATFGAFMAVLRGTDNEYIIHLLQQGAIQRHIAKNSDSTINQITNADFRQIVIPFPKRKTERMTISAILSDVDVLISNLEKLIVKKKAIKQGTMQELLTGKRRLSGFDSEWRTHKFGDIFEILPNNAFTRAEMSVTGIVKNIHYGDILTKYPEYICAESDEIPFIESGVDLSRFSEKCYVKSGDVIIADTAEDETVGKATEIIKVDCLILSGQHTLLCRPKITFAERFLGYYLNAACYHDQLIPYITGTKVSSISRASITQTILRVPENREQAAIADILTDMGNEIKELEQKLAKYRLVKQGMMSELLTGRIRLTEKEDA